MTKNSNPKTHMEDSKWTYKAHDMIGNAKPACNNLQYYNDLIEDCTKTPKTSEKDDGEMCKNLIIGINRNEIDHTLDFKIIACITSHFTDLREGFVERGAFLATAFFKKDDFEAQSKKLYKDFEDLLSSVCIKRKKAEERDIPKDFRKVHNDLKRYSDYDSPSNRDVVMYDEYRNPVFLQKAIKILQTSEHISQIKAVHYHFENILNRADHRTLKIYSAMLFNQLIDLSNNKVYEEQFKSLAYFLSTDFSYYVRAIEIFKNTKLDTLRVYLLHTFDLMEELVGLGEKIKIHLRFAEMLMDLDLKDNEFIKNSVVAFVEKGMRLIKNINELGDGSGL